MSNTNTMNTLNNTMVQYEEYEETIETMDDDREDFSNEWKIGLSEEDISHIETMLELDSQRGAMIEIY
jgi:hypothetical protein